MGLVYMRHAHTDWNGPPARVQGQRDPGLSVAGRTAAKALGANMPRPDRIIRSPARRCGETVDALFGNAPPPVAEDARLWEISLGCFEGRLVEEIAREEPEAWRAWKHLPSTARPGGGETLDEVAQRVFAALADAFDSLGLMKTSWSSAMACRCASLPVCAMAGLWIVSGMSPWRIWIELNSRKFHGCDERRHS